MSNFGILQGLEKTSKKHEEEIVVEFATDRFLHIVGVYFMIMLAIVAKVTEVAAGQKSSCYTAIGERKYDRNFILYSNAYCWQSHRISTKYNATSNGSSCANLTLQKRFDGLHFVDNAGFAKSFVQWLPYGMLMEAFLLSLPSVWWHLRVGARLMGHIKFVRLFLQDIYKATKELPGGIYRKQRNAGEGEITMDDESCRRRGQDGATECPRPWTYCSNVACKSEPMTDREMFSLLCYENFSSMVHHTYVKSVFELTSTNGLGDVRSKPLKSTILQYWYHENNFGGEVLVRSYKIKHSIGIAASMISLICFSVALLAISRSGLTTSKFLCDVLFHENACLVCTIPRMSESVAFLFTMTAMTAAYLCISVWRLWTFATKRGSHFPDFLTSISDERSAALLAAYKKTRDAE